MEELTDPWRPYRSIGEFREPRYINIENLTFGSLKGVYYMWALAETEK